MDKKSIILELEISQADWDMSIEALRKRYKIIEPNINKELLLATLIKQTEEWVDTLKGDEQRLNKMSWIDGLTGKKRILSEKISLRKSNIIWNQNKILLAYNKKIF